MEEEEALRFYCRRMISRVHRKRHVETAGREERKREKHREPGGERGAVSRSRPTELKRRRRGETGRVVGVKDRPSDHRHHDLLISGVGQRYERERDTTSPNPMMSQGRVAQLVPPQLISLLKLKTFKEELRLAAVVELHDPSICKECEQKQAALALNTFIRRRKTQLEAQTLANRLNTHLCNKDHICLLGEFVRHLPKPSDAPHRIWEELLIFARGSQRPLVALATELGHGVALTTDEEQGVILTKTQQELI